jgi:uncharacterized protein
MSHSGSLLILPSGIHGWRPAAVSDITSDDLGPILAEKTEFAFILMGTGRFMALLPQPIVHYLKEGGLAVEAMDTGAAVRTYNILLAEDRPPAAALIAV